MDLSCLEALTDPSCLKIQLIAAAAIGAMPVIKPIHGNTRSIRIMMFIH